MKEFKTKYGPWALVTGASSGIGSELARQLAAKGLNVAVAARRKERLATLVREIEGKHGVQTKAIAVDLTASDYLQTIEAETKDIEVGLLINNAGMGVPGAFLKQDANDFAKVVQLNVTTPMQLAHVFGQKMIRRERGGILFVSSTSAFSGTPYMANYAGTKAYLLSLGEGLNVELKGKGVDVTVLVPGPTRTEMVEMDNVDFGFMPSMMWMDAVDVAAAGIQGLGRKRVVVAGGMNKMMTFMMTRMMPRKSASNMFGGMMKKAMDPAIV